MSSNKLAQTQQIRTLLSHFMHIHDADFVHYLPIITAHAQFTIFMVIVIL